MEKFADVFMPAMLCLTAAVSAASACVMFVAVLRYCT